MAVYHKFFQYRWRNNASFRQIQIQCTLDCVYGGWLICRTQNESCSVEDGPSEEVQARSMERGQSDEQLSVSPLSDVQALFTRGQILMEVKCSVQSMRHIDDFRGTRRTRGVEYDKWFCKPWTVVDVPRMRAERRRKKFIQRRYINDRKAVFRDKWLQRVIERDFAWPEKYLAFSLANERSMSLSVISRR